MLVLSELERNSRGVKTFIKRSVGGGHRAQSASVVPRLNLGVSRVRSRSRGCQNLGSRDGRLLLQLTANRESKFLALYLLDRLQ